ncbi:MAG TPA: tetratricopeptide repeat protein, partial [Ktedonobacteraceae bacterium]|nr:tetratricopeptide repeat protein [Ktedonobacteraceae bacterium]
LLHGISAILLFLVLEQMTGALWRSAFVAAVFAVHPLHVESVAWISERKDVLSGLFFMLTLLAYGRYAGRQKSAGRTAWSFLASPAYWAVLVLFALGLMCKPMLVTLPFVLLLLDWWPLQRITIDNQRSSIAWLLWEKIPFLLLSAASCAVTIWAQRAAVSSLERLAFPLRVGNALVSYAAYVWQMIYPVGLAVIYPHPENHLAPWKVGVSVLLLLVVSAGVAAGARKHPYLLVGWLWYVGMLVPVIGLMQVGGQARADRYTYLPQLGLYIIVAWGAVDLCGSWRYSRVVLGSGAAVILAGLVVLARVQTTYWQNGVSLMTHALACNSDNSLAHNNLGVALARQGKLPEAIQHFERALQLKPDYAEAYDNLGAALVRQGKLPEAIEQYERALQLKPDYVEACNNLGAVLADQGKVSEAVQYYKRALEVDPSYAEAYYNLGNVLAHQGKLPEAIQHYQRALQVNPDYAEACYNMGVALQGEGKVAEAVQQFEQAIQLKSDYVEALNNLAYVLATSRNAMLHNTARAVALSQQANHLTGGENPIVLGTLATAYAEAGRYREALETVTRAVQLPEVKTNAALISAFESQLKLYKAQASGQAQ